MSGYRAREVVELLGSEVLRYRSGFRCILRAIKYCLIGQGMCCAVLLEERKLWELIICLTMHDEHFYVLLRNVEVLNIDD